MSPRLKTPAETPQALPPLTNAPFFSARNVPLWMSLVMIAAFAGIVALAPH
ncbi:MAG: hypothetical protein ACJ798_19215 [Phenylobacterium sp.]